jgi:hypothetical protein
VSGLIECAAQFLSPNDREKLQIPEEEVNSEQQ